MTSDAVGVVGAFLDIAWDFDRARDYLAPDVVWFGTRGGLYEERVIRGPDAVIDYLREIRDPWEQYAVEAERLIDAGDTVVALLRETAHTRRGDLDLHDETAMLFKVRRDKIVEAVGYLDRDEALRAAGADPP